MKIRSVFLGVMLCLLILAGSASADDIITVTGVSISNENGLIDKRIAAGVTPDSLYRFLQDLQTGSTDGIPSSFLDTWSDFMSAVSVAPSSSDAFTAPLNFIADPSNNPVTLGWDGYAEVAGVFGGGYDAWDSVTGELIRLEGYAGQDGYTTFGKAIPGLGTVLFTFANDEAHYIDAGTRTIHESGVIITSTYKAFAIVWSAPETSGVPEPTSLLLLGLGLLGLSGIRRKLKK